MKTEQLSQEKKSYLKTGLPLGLAVMLVVGLLWILGSIPQVHVSANTTSAHAPTDLANGDVITIGVASDMSGLAEWIGWRQVNAVQLAVDQINAAGGVEIGGTTYTLALVSADSGCDPTQGLAAANTLLNAGVVAVVGHTCSNASDAAQPLYAAAGVPMVSPSATRPQLTEQGYATTFRVITRDDIPPAMLVSYLHNLLAHERAAIVEMDFYGDWIGDVFSDTFTNLGGVVTSRTAINSTMDFTTTLTAIMAEEPDAILFGYDDSSAAGLLSKVAQNLGMTDVIIGWATFSSDHEILDGYASMAGAAAEGDLAVLHGRDTEDMPGYAAFNTAYVAAGFANYGDEAQQWGALAYDTLQIIVAAIGRAGSLNPADIRGEIAATTDHQGVAGTYEGFDDKGDVIPQWAWVERYQAGEWEEVESRWVFLPAMLRMERAGERINIFDSGSQTFAENTAFHIAHGFVELTEDDLVSFNFQLQVDGLYQKVDFIEVTLDDTVDPPLIHKSWVFNFPAGMDGIHTFTGHWLAPCAQVYDDCAVPEEIVETRLSSAEVTFVP